MKNPMGLSLNVLIIIYFDEDTISCMLFFLVETPNMTFLLGHTGRLFTFDELKHPQNKHFILIVKRWTSDAYVDIVELFTAQK